LVENTIYLEFLRGEKKFIGLQLFDGKRVGETPGFQECSSDHGELRNLRATIMTMRARLSDWMWSFEKA
jgi:hypothetical protein